MKQLSPESFSNVKGTTFKVNMNHKAFNIISDAIYTNKEQSMVRELICNGIDSHTRAKVSRPVKVQMPTELDKYFVVTDYGTGLSHEEIMSVYTTYFESTKDTDNSEIGGRGLGSKTPFAISDMFTVIAGKNGVVNTYCMFLDNGIPAVELLTTEKSNYTGLTVKVPCDELPFNTLDQVKYMNIITNVPECFKKLSVDKVINDLKQESYTMITNNHLWDTILLHIGGVLYYVDKIHRVLNQNDVNVLNREIIIDVPIGTIELTASRENIVESSSNESKINKIITEVIQKEKSKLFKQINNKISWQDFKQLFLDNMFLKSPQIVDEAFALAEFNPNISIIEGLTYEQSKLKEFPDIPLNTSVIQTPFKNVSLYEKEASYFVNKVIGEDTRNRLFGTHHTFSKKYKNEPKKIENIDKYCFYYFKSEELPSSFQDLEYFPGLPVYKRDVKNLPTSLPHWSQCSVTDVFDEYLKVHSLLDTWVAYKRSTILQTLRAEITSNPLISYASSWFIQKNFREFLEHTTKENKKIIKQLENAYSKALTNLPTGMDINYLSPCQLKYFTPYILSKFKFRTLYNLMEKLNVTD